MRERTKCERPMQIESRQIQAIQISYRRGSDFVAISAALLVAVDSDFWFDLGSTLAPYRCDLGIWTLESRSAAMGGRKEATAAAATAAAATSQNRIKNILRTRKAYDAHI